MFNQRNETKKGRESTKKKWLEQMAVMEKTAYFAEINRARFKKKVVPGDVLTLTTEIIRQKGPIGIGSATASVRGEVVCTAELTFAIGSKEE